MPLDSAPRVSVIVPLYNKAATIARALASIAQQTYRDYEVIVVDDGSTDGSANIASRFEGDRLKVVSQRNAGPGAARNRGVSEARGSVLAFLDADDEWLPRFLERNIAALDESDCPVASTTCGYVTGRNARSTAEVWRKRGLTQGAFRASAGTSAVRLAVVLRYMNSWSTVIRKSVVARYGGFYEDRCVYGEDSYLYLKVLLNETVRLTLEPLAHWHDEASSLSRNLRGPRPIEPMLADPQALYDACPAAMRELLDRLLAIRAGKTACMLAFWGKSKQGRALLRRFARIGYLRYRSVQLGCLCATPLAALAGSAVRRLSPLLPVPGQLGSACWSGPPDATASDRARGTDDVAARS